jgi:hypothetical protein
VLRGSADRTLIMLGYPGERPDARRQRASWLIRGTRASSASAGTLEDIAPTVAYVLGLPASAALQGRPLTALFNEGFRTRHPVREVTTWGLREPGTSPPAGQPGLDDEMRERLRSLGYVR